MLKMHEKTFNVTLPAVIMLLGEAKDKMVRESEALVL